MSIETISRNDPRYSTLVKGRNARFPASAADAASRIELCDNAEDVALALQRAVSEGLRPTVRSGGHCYEDFVYSNPGGVVLDMRRQSTGLRRGRRWERSTPICSSGIT